ncbi:hypothetical protein HMI56_005148 [Coelomomyces lativittatus]|nr:hypothetical protein HMI56_005148 [Coelomomyces lativittatus]
MVASLRSRNKNNTLLNSSIQSSSMAIESVSDMTNNVSEQEEFVETENNYEEPRQEFITKQMFENFIKNMFSNNFNHQEQGTLSSANTVGSKPREENVSGLATSAFSRVPVFTGVFKPGSVALSDFVAAVDVAIYAAQLPQHHEVGYVLGKLDEEARFWVGEQMLLNPRGSGGEINSWKRLKTLLEEKFVTDYGLVENMENFTKAKQGGQDIHAFNKTFRRLAKAVGPEVSEKGKVAHYLNCIDENISSKVKTNKENFRDLETVLEAATLQKPRGKEEGLIGGHLISQKLLALCVRKRGIMLQNAQPQKISQMAK